MFKKVFVLILALTSLLTLISCGQTGGKAVTGASTTSSSPSPFPVVKAECGGSTCM